MLKVKLIPATQKTPEVLLDPKGFVRIKGRCMDKNYSGCPRPISDWIDEYKMQPAEITIIDIYLEYVNGFNSAILITLFRKFLTLKPAGRKLVINWFYEEGDEDILEQGEYISSAIKTPFNYIMVQEPVHV